MTELARFMLEDGGSVLIEVDDEPGVRRVARQGQLLAEAKASFEAALSGVRDAALAALSQFTSMPRQPDEVALRFGVKIDVQAGAVIAKTGVEGQLEVKLTWKREPARSVQGEGEAEET